MTDSALKMILLFDPEAREYKPAAHNLAASAATDLVQQFSTENRTTRTLDQVKRHRNPDPTKCMLCKRAAGMVSQTRSPGGETVDAARL